MAEAKVLSLQDRIAGSKKAAAVERAWEVAKALEDKHQIAGLKWVSPVRTERGGISREVDFADYPQGVSTFMPLPMRVSVVAPAKVLVPGEGMDFAWTMPLLTRVRPAQELPMDVRGKLGIYGADKTRPTVEIVTFLPFPRADAPSEEQFSPEFFVALDIDKRHLGEDTYFCAVIRFGGKLVAQMVHPDRTSVVVVADPYHETLFRAEMLVSLTKAELAKTPDKAGTLEVYVYRIAKRTVREFDYTRFIKDIGSISSLGGSSTTPLDRFDDLFSPTRSDDFEPTRGGDDYFLGGGGMKGGSSFSTLGGSSRRFTSIPGGAQKPTLPTPAAAPKEVGDTRVSEGTKGEAVQYNTLEGYGVDSGFAVAHISLRCLGVREASREATIRILESIAGEP